MKEKNRIMKFFACLNRDKKPKAQSEQPAVAVKPVPAKGKDHNITGEELAAIATALRLHFAAKHDVESEIITMDAPPAPYSPWAQKHLTFKRVIRK